jgi:hypothetical protein
VKTVSGEEYGQPDRRLAGGLLAPGQIAPDIARFEPWKGHRNAETAQKSAAGEVVGFHI